MKKQEHFIFLFLLLCSVCVGLCYVFLVPPWMHYDEPNHFEYVQLMVKWNRVPQIGEYDQAIRIGIAQSEIDKGFFSALRINPPTNLNSATQPVWIGPQTQLGDPPLYYFYAGLPLRLFPGLDVAAQLYLSRIMSFLLYILTVIIAWMIASELAPENHPLRYSLSFGVALLPGFVDVMTAVNNGVAEIALVSLVIWGMVRLLKRGFSWPVILVSASAIILVYWSKPTGLFILPFLILTLILTLTKPPFRRYIWVGLTVTIVAALILGLDWHDSLFWYRSSSQNGAFRIARTETVLGKYAFQINLAAQVYPRWNAPFYQPLPLQNGLQAKSADYTVGAWMWSDKPIQVRLPDFAAGSLIHNITVDLDSTPRFFAYHVKLPLAQNIFPLRLNLDPRTKNTKTGIVYYDGLVIVEGNFPLEQVPSFDDVDASKGKWGGRSFVNMVRNASAEMIGPRLRRQIDIPLANFLPNQILPSSLLMSVLDRDGAWWFYYQTVVGDFYTFWAKFGWGAIPLLGSKPYRIFIAVTIIGIFSSLISFTWLLINRKPQFRYDIGVLFLAITGMYWLFTFVRGMSFLGSDKLYYSPARYAYPALIPTIFFLLGGISSLIHNLQNRLGKAYWTWFIIQIASLLVVNVWSLKSILSFMEV